MGQERVWMGLGTGTVSIRSTHLLGTSSSLGCRTNVRMAGSVPKTEQGLRGIAADDRSMDLRRHDWPDAKAVSSLQCFLDTLLEGV